ncbi:hypothetical protein STSP2_02838 [Anaerohalosphaera lusitana]|uniref:General secretion pathway, M protein n=1 Tax=Anaerohalosphaera lusitana TaxID=1936003 RepID=A0A1U9NPH3_9BACT|nr:hypothetical protein [Anaerohalosphaera lusitana]AQT69644.1 hypothetical protein STSP2_02838 [Anaerohalosphaera lusitana]
MNEFYKKKDFYFILVPSLALIWVLTTIALKLPAAQNELDRTADQWQDAKPLVTEILTHDPGRLEYAAAQSQDGDFDFAKTIARLAPLNGISPSAYDLRSGPPITRGGNRTKTATLSIEDPVSIVTLTEFMSTLLSQWPDLQCDSAKIVKQSDGPDRWKADFRLTYNYGSS